VSKDANSPRRQQIWLGLGLLVFVVAMLALSLLPRFGEGRAMVFSVPPGTAARQAAGETVTIFPQTINLKLDQQDTLIIRNDDSVPVTVGPFKIEPGQRFVQRYTNPGTFDLLCSVHGGERLRIVVER
jgi:hypothetical protein